jgi:hypothetical protein
LDKGYTEYVSINILYYCSDIIGLGNEKSISDNKLKEINDIRRKNEHTLDELLLLNGIGFNEFRINIVKHLEGLIVNLLNSYKVSKCYFSEYKIYLENNIYDVLEKDFTLRPSSFLNYVQKNLKGNLIKLLYLSNKNINKEVNYNIQKNYSSISNPENYYVKKEEKEIIKGVLKDLEKDELIFIACRFGFQCQPMTVEEIQIIHFPDLTVEELHKFEISILEKLRAKEKVKCLRR